jgi:2'-5' RNA ligase
MKFKQWLQNETMTSTADVANFQNRVGMARRWWVSDWEKEMASGKKRKKTKFTYQLPQVHEGFGKYSFSCVMFDLKDKDASKVLSWSKKHIPDDVLFTDGEKGREDEIHITLLYGLHTSKPDDVEKIVSNFKPEEISFGEISKFESEEYDVLKISVEGKILHKINKALKDLPHTSSYPIYKPHCTLAYVKKGSCDHLLGKKYFEDWSVILDSVIFSSSDGDKTEIDLG